MGLHGVGHDWAANTQTVMSREGTEVHMYSPLKFTCSQIQHFFLNFKTPIEDILSIQSYDFKMIVIIL